MLPSHEEVRLATSNITARNNLRVQTVWRVTRLFRYPPGFTICSRCPATFGALPKCQYRALTLTLGNVQVAPISEDDYFARNPEFSTWLRERRKVRTRGSRLLLVRCRTCQRFCLQQAGDVCQPQKQAFCKHAVRLAVAHQKQSGAYQNAAHTELGRGYRVSFVRPNAQSQSGTQATQHARPCRVG